MRIHFILALVAALSACKRSQNAAADPVPVKETVAGVPLIDFTSPEVGFSCRAPSDWGVPERKFDNKSGIFFVGPLDTVKRTTARITIRKYPEFDPSSQYNDAQKYAETFWQLDPRGKQPTIEKKDFGGTTVLEFHQERQNYKVHGSPNIDYMIRYDFALIPIKGGFFEIQHSAPTDSCEKTLPVFEAVVRSFKPKT